MTTPSFDFKKHLQKQAREKLLVSKICKLTDAEQIKLLAYLLTLEMEFPPRKDKAYLP